MSTDHLNPPADEDVHALANLARRLGLARNNPAPATAATPVAMLHVGQEDAGLLARRAHELGLARKAPETAAVAKPSIAATPADPFGRAAPKPPAGFVEVAAPAGTRIEPGAPRTRHYRAVGGAAMRTRVITGAILRPGPGA